MRGVGADPCAAAAAVMGFPTPFLQLKPKLIALEPPVGGYPRSRRHMRRLRCALNSENVVTCNLSSLCLDLRSSCTFLLGFSLP